MDPATITALAAVLGPVIKGMMGDKGGMSSTYSGKQRSTIDNLLDMVKGGQTGQNMGAGQDWLSSLFNDPEFFKQFEAPLQRQFQEETIPGLANRFAGMGSGGSTGSTGFRNQATREAGNLSTNIGALRGGMQQQGVNQASQNYFNMLQQGLTPYKNVYQQSTY